MKLKNRTVFIILSLLVIFTGISLYFIQNKSVEITPQEARKNISAGLYDYIVDVRTDEEWLEGHLPNSIHIPIGTIVTELPKRIPDRNARILFVCKKGIRASAVNVIANKLGYKNVQAMIGNYREAAR